MARVTRSVVQSERLSDQVYELLKEDLKLGEFLPGQRLLEVELAARYKVSRTPIREALFQLARDGMLIGNERGYTAPVITATDIAHRLEVKRLLDPVFAQHAAAEADAAQIKAMSKALSKEIAAHEAGKVKAFHAANQELRSVYHSMCKNVLLSRYLRLADDQYDNAHTRIYEEGENRLRQITYDKSLLDAISARDAPRAVAAVVAFLDFLETFYSEPRQAEASA